MLLLLIDMKSMRTRTRVFKQAKTARCEARAHRLYNLNRLNSSILMSSATRSYRLPDLHAVCPWTASFNQHYEEARAASAEWVLSFNFFSGKKLEFFQQGGSELLCAWAYPYAGREQLRTACDFVNLLFTIDEISDDQSGEGAKATGAIFMNTMKDDNFDDGSKLCKMTKEYALSSEKSCPPAHCSPF